jgi:hypothetical protein
MFPHVGLLFNRPPGTAGLPFNQSSDSFYRLLCPTGREVQGFFRPRHRNRENIFVWIIDEQADVVEYLSRVFHRDSFLLAKGRQRR